jgi:tellurite resistance protein TerC
MEAAVAALGVDVLGKPAWAWFLFLGLVGALLTFDLGVLHKKQHEIEVAESLGLSAGYIGFALLFGAGVWWQLGPEPGLNYVTGFLIEKSLALDNIFVISLIFTYFSIPRLYQHRVLFWGILGVIALRAVMIGLGATLVAEFAWILYVFSAFLLLTGIKMLVMRGEPVNIADNVAVRFVRRHMKVTDRLHGERFFVRLPGDDGKLKRYATPLFLTLVLVEFADIVFAVDSVPAIFAITADPYIVYTSNIFAILGLRALYFALAAMMHRFVYLKYALGAILVFIGVKIFYNQIFGKLDPLIVLAVTGGLIAVGVAASWVKTAGDKVASKPAPAEARGEAGAS